MKARKTEGFYNGIQLGESYCKAASFPIILPLYIENILVIKKIKSDWGGTYDFEELPCYISENIYSYIFDAMYEFCNKFRAQTIFISRDCLKYTLHNNTICSDNLSKKERKYLKGYTLYMTFTDKQNLCMSHNEVFALMAKLRTGVYKILKSYKPKDYKPGKRKVLSTINLYPPLPISELPF
jgi:hypothetical protein